ncbi:MAG: hypothetical protein WKG00_15445 [Polyangiaceae bacterium]
MPLVETHFAESARVLAPAARWPSSSSPTETIAPPTPPMSRLATSHGFEVEVAAATPLSIWDAPVWLLRRR